MLHGPGKHTYRLYTILDVFSRKVVGHRVEHTETAALAAALIRDAVTENRQRPAVLHADNGAPMRAGSTLQLAQSLGITLSYSRPRVSDDNPYSESLFKTVKYDLDFPRRFQDLQHARDYMAAFFADYNANHRHSGLNYYTPDTVHEGRVDQARRRRQATLDACHARQSSPVPKQTHRTSRPVPRRHQPQNQPAVTNSLIYTGFRMFSGLPSVCKGWNAVRVPPRARMTPRQRGFCFNVWTLTLRGSL